MSHGIYSALSGAVAQERSLECTAQNLANAATSGYRGAQPVFHEVMTRAGTAGSGPALRFSAMSGTTLDLTPGDVRETGRPLDVALAASDFLAVSTPAGERYTRAGALKVAPDGALQTAGGAPLLGEDGRPVRATPGQRVTIEPDGSVRAGEGVVGRLKVVTFAKPEAMVRQGDTLFAAGDAGAPAASARPLTIGSLEGSNASPIRGMTELMRATRLFEAVQRTIDAFHDADRKVVTSVPAR